MNKNKEEIGEKYKRIGKKFILQEFNPSDDEKELVDMIDDLDRKKGKWVEQVFQVIKYHRLLIHQAILSAEDNMRKRCLEALPKVIDIDDQTNYRESAYEDGVDDGFNKALYEVKQALLSLPDQEQLSNSKTE